MTATGVKGASGLDESGEDLARGNYKQRDTFSAAFQPAFAVSTLRTDERADPHKSGREQTKRCTRSDWSPLQGVGRSRSSSASKRSWVFDKADGEDDDRSSQPDAWRLD